MRSGSGERVHLLDVRIVELAEVVPDGGSRRDDVGLVAAVRDHVVRALLQPQMLAPEVPADIHQLDGIERAATAPRRTRGMRAATLEAEQHGHEAVARDVAP